MRSLRWTFSTMASSAIWRSSTSRICTGTCRQSAAWAARSRRSPAISSKPSPDAADDQRLQNAVRADAVGQIGDLGFVERLPRLVRIALDRVAIEPDLAVLVARHAVVDGRRSTAAAVGRRGGRLPAHPRRDPTGLPNHVPNVALSTRPNPP